MSKNMVANKDQPKKGSKSAAPSIIPTPVPSGRDFPALGRQEPAQHITGLGQGISNGGRGWNPNPWGGFATPRSRDSSRFALPTERDAITGSGSLVQSSEADTPWPYHRSGWSHSGTTGTAAMRSSASPQRQPSSQFALGSLHVESTIPSLLAGSRFDTSSTTPANPLGHYPRSSDESLRPYDPAGRWPDTQSVQSPTDDRRSLSNSDYFDSGVPSRNGSLPPSRHGNEPVTYSQVTDFRQAGAGAAPASRGHMPTFSSHSNGRVQPERQNSQHSDILSSFSRLSLDSGDSVPQRNGHHGSHLNGHVNGHLNGHVNGHMNGHINGHLNGQPNGQNSHHATMPQGMSDISYDDLALLSSFTQDGTALSTFRPPVAVLERTVNATTNGHTNGNVNGHRQDSYHIAGIEMPYSDRTAERRLPLPLLDQRLRSVQQEQSLHNQHGVAQQHHLPPQMNPLYFNPQFYRGAAMQYPMTGLSSFPGMSIPGITIYDAPKGPKDQVLPVQSALLAQFAADQAIKSPDRPSRKWELMDVKQHMVEFCGDQAGSRFIQKKIETANSDERAIVFAELYDNLLQLMKDVFGNYVIQKLFEHGDQNQKKMMADKMRTHVGDLATSMFGCRVLQKAFEFVLTDQQVELAQELRGDVYKCVMDQQGNHVIQRVIERVPPEHWQFIVNESRGHLAEMSQNQYGCRVVQRMLDYCDASLQAAMLDELVPQGEKLITDTYGNYVAQHIIIKGPEKESSKMVEYVKKNWFQYSKHKFASNVVERVLVYKGDDVRRYIMCAVLDLCTLSAPTGPANGHAREHNCALQQLIRDNYGNYVVSKILGTLPDADHALFVARLQPEMDRARKSVGAKQLAAMELKMHNRCDIETFERGFTGDPDKRANGPPGRARDVRTPVRGSGHRNGINPQAQPFGVPSGPAYRGSFGGVAPAGPGAGAGQPARSPLPRGGSAGAGASAAADGQERTQSPPATNGVNGHAFGGAS